MTSSDKQATESNSTRKENTCSLLRQDVNSRYDNFTVKNLRIEHSFPEGNEPTK
jgi:hypothetical protein